MSNTYNIKSANQSDYFIVSGNELQPGGDYGVYVRGTVTDANGNMFYAVVQFLLSAIAAANAAGGASAVQALVAVEFNRFLGGNPITFIPASGPSDCALVPLGSFSL